MTRNVLILVGAYYVSAWLILPVWWPLSRLTSKRVYHPGIEAVVMDVLHAIPPAIGVLLGGVAVGYLVETSSPSRWAIAFAVLVAAFRYSSRTWHIQPEVSERVSWLVQSAAIGGVAALGVVLGRRWRDRRRGLPATKEVPALAVPDSGPKRIPDRSSESESFGDGSNAFALAMYGQLRKRTGNLFFSPFSIRTALCTAEAGARGETTAQMREVLRISSSDEALQGGLAEAVQRLNAGGQYEMAVANSLWGQDGAPILPEYLARIERRYGGSMNLVDFRRAAEAARATINRWVEDKTRGKIRDLITSGGLHGDTRLVLANAIYFKGMWVSPFFREDTLEQPFHLEGGGRVRAPLMRQQSDVRYTQAAGYQAVELIYRGGALSMVVLLPDRQDGLQDLEAVLSARLLDECVARMDFREVKLFLPRFQVAWGTGLRDELAALGMPLAFDSAQADFSGINGHVPPDDDSLYLSAVFHKALVEVNEEGTEAAAATMATVELTSAVFPSDPPPVPVFRADHPFLFAIRDRQSAAILFLGRIADPTRES